MQNLDYNSIQNMDIQELEELFLQENEDSLKLPKASSYRGEYLLRIDNSGAKKWYNKYAQELMFNKIPFGLNFFIMILWVSLLETIFSFF